MTIRGGWRGLVAGVIGVLVLLPGCSAPTGTAHIADSGEYGASGSYDLGLEITESVTTVEVRKGPITLVSAEPVLEDNGVVEYLGVMARTPDRGVEGGISYITVAEGWPLPPRIPIGDGDDEGEHPSRDEVPVPNSPELLEGFEVPSASSNAPDLYEVNILFGYRIVAEGRAVRKGVNLVYEYEGRRYRVFLQSEFVLCAYPPGEFVPCPT